LELREFTSRIRSKEFNEKFFSYLAHTLHQFSIGVISEQSDATVVELIKKYNDTIRTLIGNEYVIEDGSKASLDDFREKLDKLHGDIKQGSQWGRKVIVDKLKDKGFPVDFKNMILGIRLRNSSDDNTPPKPKTKKEEKMQRKEKGSKNKKSRFGAMLNKKATVAEVE